MHNSSRNSHKYILKSSKIAQIIFVKMRNYVCKFHFYVNFTHYIYYDLHYTLVVILKLLELTYNENFFPPLLFRHYIFRHCIFPYTIFKQTRNRVSRIQTSDRDTSISPWRSRYWPRRARGNRGSATNRSGQKSILGVGSIAIQEIRVRALD